MKWTLFFFGNHKPEENLTQKKNRKSSKQENNFETESL
ncbi:hypothetical protein LEP1GSC133_1350 [Leptospira borgpetersenii serovar Pomona str. 200901868]|uniref:Uncharacterized protein n=1 Tax=Leptospira borgpetersenii serovar Pomona str. 200901868 TaxID=1192866 RepID=M6W7D6_LEPBO|nr:hypothetical protein LEP1GSC133_1350 [Leptospira borgpetersenii serovar Pomona str. 200901868]